MQSIIFEISAKKYSLGLPNNKNDTATILPKTTIMGIIGAFAKIQRYTEEYARLMEGSMLDVLIEAKTPLKKLEKDTKLNAPWKIVVNAEAPFKKEVIFQITAVPTNEEGAKLLQDFEKGIKKFRRLRKGDKRAVYLGRQGYPLAVQNLRWVDFEKINPANIKGIEAAQNSIIPEDKNIVVKSEPQKTIIVPMAYSMKVVEKERTAQNRRYRITNETTPFVVEIKGPIENSVYKVDNRIIICM
ncbi:hypothetical protein [Thermoanaerobacter mathranii]|uniref:hypothetical protein n=1 Tax=Thermoanaerobacter mathranii TaxID=583357 RepID=UPI003D6BD606